MNDTHAAPTTPASATLTPSIPTRERLILALDVPDAAADHRSNGLLRCGLTQFDIGSIPGINQGTMLPLVDGTTAQSSWQH
jgi:hypothetical protein